MRLIFSPLSAGPSTSLLLLFSVSFGERYNGTPKAYNLQKNDLLMKKIERLVIHCTATPPGREVSADEIRAWHTAPIEEGGRGWHQVGYTDLIHLDGTIERLVDNNEDATVDPWEVTNGAKGYNTTSRHIAYVGGIASDGRTPRDTRTPQQRTAMERYVRDFLARFPQVAVVGHNELAAKACPSFDVQGWLHESGILP